MAEVLSEMEVGDSFLSEEKKLRNMHAHVNHGKLSGKLPSTFKIKTRKRVIREEHGE